MSGTRNQVDILNLLESRALRNVETKYLSSTTTRVQDLALIADIEDIVSVGPDTLILLSQRAAMGGWMISAALRYAWERRASALIVPKYAVSDTEIELAKRLDVSLLATEAEVTRMAIEVAMQIGVEKSGAAARIQALMDRLSRTRSLPEALELLSDELNGRSVRVQSAGAAMVNVVGLASDTEDPQSRGTFDVEVSAPIYPEDPAQHLLNASVWSHEADYAEQVLRAAVPMVRALLDSARLNAIRASLPPITLAALAGVQGSGSLDVPGAETLTETFNWPTRGAYLIACILTTDRDLLGTAVHQVWEGAFPEVPLARISDGWLAVMPVQDTDAYPAILEDMKRQFRPLRVLDLKLGVSTLRQDVDKATEAIREAWFAARLAVPSTKETDESPVRASMLSFGEISTGLIDKLLPEDLASQLARAMLPELLDDPNAEELIDSVVAYLNCRGSASHAAKHLGLHRNTIQARVRRAEELGVSLALPEELLSTHMLLSAISRSRHRSARDNQVE